mmetsp:Transcript_1964/g.7089  ORF Transcript_1964/g.7089 Transcript_1964/m.7089 type:complete len:225 (-) Transcript_1964:65-739(-)
MRRSLAFSDLASTVPGSGQGSAALVPAFTSWNSSCHFCRRSSSGVHAAPSTYFREMRQARDLMVGTTGRGPPALTAASQESSARSTSALSTGMNASMAALLSMGRESLPRIGEWRSTLKKGLSWPKMRPIVPGNQNCILLSCLKNVRTASPPHTQVTCFLPMMELLKTGPNFLCRSARNSFGSLTRSSVSPSSGRYHLAVHGGSTRPPSPRWAARSCLFFLARR